MLTLQACAIIPGVFEIPPILSLSSVNVLAYLTGLMETIYWHWPVYCKGSHKGLNDEMWCSLQACHPWETSWSSEPWHMQRPHYSGRTWNPCRWWSFTQSSSCPRGSGGAWSPNPQMSPKFVQVTSTFRGCQPSMTSLVYKNRIYSFRGSTNFRGCCHDRKKKIK